MPDRARDCRADRIGLWSEYANKKAAAQAAAAEEAQKAKAAQEAKQEESSAIELAKNGHNLVAGRVFARKPDPDLLTNDFQIRTFMSEIHGDVDIIGWRARKYNDTTFVVSFTYRQNGEGRGWPFEVNVPAGVVRAINGDAELERKYASHF